MKGGSVFHSTDRENKVNKIIFFFYTFVSKKEQLLNPSQERAMRPVELARHAIVKLVSITSSERCNKYVFYKISHKSSYSHTILSVVIAPSSKDLTRFWSASVTGISLMDTISSYFLKTTDAKIISLP